MKQPEKVEPLAIITFVAWGVSVLIIALNFFMRQF